MAVLRRHLLLVLTLPVTILLGLVALHADLSANAAAQSTQRQDRARAQQMLGGLTEQYLKFTFLDVNNEARSQHWVLSTGSTRDTAALRAWVRQDPLHFAGAALTDLLGRPLATAGVTPASSTDPAFAPLRSALLAGRPGLSDLIETPSGPLVAFAVPVEKAGNVAGLFLGFADPRTWPLQNYTAHLNLGPDAGYAIADSRGVAVAASDAASIGRHVVTPATGPTSVVERDGVVTSAARAGDTGWTSMTTQPVAAFYGSLGKARSWLVIALAALLVLVVVALLVADVRRRRVLQQLADEAVIDPLTGVGTRRLLDMRLTAALARRRRHQSTLSLLFCDLDGFKPINDTYGHRAGDTVLRVVAQRLKAQIREDDFVARAGGDEFVIVIEDLAGDGDARELAARLLRAVREPISIGGATVNVGVSIGIASLDEGDAEAAGLLAAADSAMYRAKERGCGYAVVRLDASAPGIIPEQRSSVDEPASIDLG